MGVYGTITPAPVLRVGEEPLVLNNASTGGAGFLQQFQVDSEESPATITVYNHSNTALFVYVSDEDTGVSNYLSLAGAPIISNPSAASFTTTAKYVAFSTNYDPESGIISVGR